MVAASEQTNMRNFVCQYICLFGIRCIVLLSIVYIRFLYSRKPIKMLILIAQSSAGCITDQNCLVLQMVPILSCSSKFCRKKQLAADFCLNEFIGFSVATPTYIACYLCTVKRHYLNSCQSKNSWLENLLNHVDVFQQKMSLTFCGNADWKKKTSGKVVFKVWMFHERKTLFQNKSLNIKTLQFLPHVQVCKLLQTKVKVAMTCKLFKNPKKLVGQ